MLRFAPGGSATPRRAPAAPITAWALALAGLACLALTLGAASASAASAWLPAQSLSAPLRSASNPRVAMDAAGGTVAIWERQDDKSPSRNVQVSTRNPGGAFSAPLTIAAHSQNPEIAITPGGEAIAAWWHFRNPTGYVLQAAFRPPGGTFSAAVDVATLPAGVNPSTTRIATNAAGDTVIAWAQYDPAKSEESSEPEEPFSVYFVEAAVRPAGGGFTAPATVSAPPTINKSADGPRVAMTGAGEALVVWNYQDGIDSQVQVASRPPGGGFSAPGTISEAGEAVATPDVAADAAGNAVAVWMRLDGPEESAVETSTRAAAGGFGAPAQISESGGNAFAPEIGISAAGEAIVAWTDRDSGGDLDVQTSIRPSGGGFGAPVRVSTPGVDAHFLDLATSPAGDALVSWSESTPGGEVAAASVRRAGGGFTAPTAISAESSGFLHPDGAVSSSGDATVVWPQAVGANDLVQAAGYDAGPPAFRGVSIPAHGMVRVPVSFSANPFDVWPIASTVFSFGDGAAAAGTVVSHAYRAPGLYPVWVTSVDGIGNTVTASGTIAVAPSLAFRIAKRKRNKKRGTVKFTVYVSGPGRVVVRGRGVKRRQKRAKAAGNVRLVVAAKGRLRKRLNRKGKARTRVTVTFTPDGGSASARKRVRVTLVKKKRRGSKGRRAARRHIRTAG